MCFADHGWEVGHHRLWPECCLEVIRGPLRISSAVVKMENHPRCLWKGTTVNAGARELPHTYTQMHSRHTEVLVFPTHPSGARACVQREVNPGETAVALRPCPCLSFCHFSNPGPALRFPLFVLLWSDTITPGRHLLGQHKSFSSTENSIYLAMFSSLNLFHIQELPRPSLYFYVVHPVCPLTLQGH